MYSATASGTQYRTDCPSGTRRRTSVAEISIAGTSTTVSEIPGRRGHAAARAGKDRDPGQRADPVRLVPGRQLGRGIGAQQQDELRVRLPLAQMPQGVNGIGGPGPVQLGALEREPGRPRERQRQHRGSVLGEARCCPCLNGCSRAGTKRSSSSPSVSAATCADDQMSMVNRIERSAEEADHPASGSGGVWRDILAPAPGALG